MRLLEAKEKRKRLRKAKADQEKLNQELGRLSLTTETSTASSEVTPVNAGSTSSGVSHDNAGSASGSGQDHIMSGV